jgi:hypothetical protein
MKQSIKSVLTGITGTLSSKRVALFLFIFAFFGQCVAWYIFKLKPDDTLRDELFYTMSGLILAVFGEQALPSLKGSFKNRDESISDDTKR